MIHYIENVSIGDIRTGMHTDMGENTMLIRIQDPATSFHPTKQKFKEVHMFEFLDVEDDDAGFPDEVKISDDQAKEIVRLLQHALDNSMNVIVHCHAGICRSGAVVEVGTMMGFTPINRFRLPNMRVKHKMMQVLGWTYGSEEILE